MMTSHRGGFVRFQQDLARQALFRGQLGAARVALRVLQTSDFAGGAPVSAVFLAVLRDPKATDHDLIEAIHALIHLGAAGR